MLASRPLPGIQFEAQPPAPAEVLPRMDIPVFVGFAANGPVHRPVVIEDIVLFHDIFGEDLPLARTERAGEILRAYLAPAVRAFFRNGGRRCYVVRVTAYDIDMLGRRVSTAVTGTVELPGVFLLVNNQLTPATALARSPGSWSDGLTVSAATVMAAIPLTAFAPHPFRLTVPPSVSARLRSGELLRIDDGAGVVYWAEVDTRTPVGGVVEIGTRNVFEQPLASPLSGGSLTAEIVTLSLRVSTPAGGEWRIGDLGFSPLHNRYWAALPSDQWLYKYGPGRPEDPYFQLRSESARPRFPLAGTENADALYLPLDLPAIAAKRSVLEPAAGTALERDGLARFDAGLFLDRALAGDLSTDLINHADALRYQSNPGIDAAGVHAALAIEEATLIAVPDAVHRSWEPALDDPIASPPASGPPVRPEWWRFLECPHRSPFEAVSEPPGQGFLPCNLQRLAVPLLDASTLPGGKVSVSWTEVAGAVYTLEQSRGQSFSSSVAIYSGDTLSRLLDLQPGSYFFRVWAAIGANRSDYSNTSAIRVEPALQWVELPAPHYDNRPLLDVQRALLRLCAARGDMFAALSFPRHYREADTLDAKRRLLDPAPVESAATPPLSFGEQMARSYGAVYHPWLRGREENVIDEIRTTPPEGAICGVIARRTLARGAWISPANEGLHGVAALDPPPNPRFRRVMQDEQINVIRQTTTGFLTFSADTLSADEDFRPINVRRLMSLLRRLALRKGADYVFEPNSDEFRRLVQRGFEAVLESLLRRGAFAGSTAATSFQVVNDAEVNPPGSVEQGRLITEIRVAPSRPLEFLLVRLIQSADRSSVTEGR